jgi:hypothetical protein
LKRVPSQIDGKLKEAGEETTAHDEIHGRMKFKEQQFTRVAEPRMSRLAMGARNSPSSTFDLDPWSVNQSRSVTATKMRIGSEPTSLLLEVYWDHAQILS